jgi:hypothetical protein
MSPPLIHPQYGAHPRYPAAGFGHAQFAVNQPPLVEHFPGVIGPQPQPAPPRPMCPPAEPCFQTLVEDPPKFPGVIDPPPPEDERFVALAREESNAFPSVIGVADTRPAIEECDKMKRRETSVHPMSRTDGMIELLRRSRSRFRKKSPRIERVQSPVSTTASMDLTCLKFFRPEYS